MSEENNVETHGAPMWLNEFGHILGFGKLTNRDSAWAEYWRTNYHNPLLIGEECVCKTYEVIARCITDSTGRQGQKIFDLRPYKYAGHPRLGMDV